MATSPSNRASVVKSGDVVEGRYRILDVLGEGGMGTVFLAEHALIKRRVAIKILHPELATDGDVIERFMNEARAAGTLGHPNIVESTDMGFTHDHVPYIVFEFLEGSLLTDEIYRVGGMPVRRAVRIAQQIASALHAAHVAGIVHRDLKSDNIFLTDKDEALDHVKVLDFGISRFLQLDESEANKGIVMGTPEFMAPEQITDPDHVDRRADVYALGVILYEMLTCRRPFKAEADPRLLMERIVRDAPPPLDRAEVPPGLADLILTKLLAKDPADRCASMQDVEAALDAFAAQTDVPRRRTRPAPAMTGMDHDVARLSGTIPRPANSANTPWPAPQLPTGAAMIALGKAPAPKRPWLVYGLATAGLVVGAGGFTVGLRGHAMQVASTPAHVLPAANTQAAPAELPKAAAPHTVAVVVAANAPGAQVSFRRRVLATPAKLEVAASAIIEVVEVSAPGYATKRYWLTFDRATTLDAQLSKGTVAVEATDEETLVALGELPADSLAKAPVVATADSTVTAITAASVARAAAMPAAAMTIAMTTPTAAKTVAAPVRKVGHAGATAPALAPVTPELAATITPAAQIPTAPAAEPQLEASAAAAVPELAVAPTPTEAPSPAPAPTATPAPASSLTELHPVDAPAAEPPGRADLVARPLAPARVTTPSYAAAQISSVYAQHRAEVVNCIAEGRGASSTLHGTLELQLQVDASGRVKRVQIQSGLRAPLVAACIVKSATGWKFPAHGGSELAAVKYPLIVN